MPERYKASAFWVLLAAMVATFVVGIDLQDARGSKGRGLEVLQAALRKLLVDPLGPVGAVALIMALGFLAAFLTRPRTRKDG